MTVPPALIVANRSLLTLLTATNILGQNTPAILETEAHYMEMWAQDVAAMTLYALQSQAATSQLQTPTAAPEVVKSTPTANTNIAPGNVVNNLASASGGTSTPASDFFANPFISTLNGYGQNVVSGGAFNPTNIVSALTGGHDFFPGQYPDVLEATPRNLFSEPEAVAAGIAPPQSAVGSAGAASRVGALSVPPSWGQAAPPPGEVRLANQTIPLTSEGSSGASGAPGMFGAPGTRSGFANQPKYGQKLTIIPRPPAGG